MSSPTHCEHCGGLFTELDPQHWTGVALHRACYGIVTGDWSRPKPAELQDTPGQSGWNPCAYFKPSPKG